MDKTKLVELKRLMVEKQEADGFIKTLRDNFAKSIEDRIAARDAIGKDIEEIKSALGIEAMKVYEETGSKKPGGGLGIRVSKKISYDKDKALEYAKEKDMFLTLDVKAFEKVAADLGLDFVTIGSVASVTFPRDAEKIVVEE